MDPQLRRPLFLVSTAAAIALAVWITLRHVDHDETDAYALGGTFGRFVLALVVVLVVRLIARSMSGRPDLVSFPAVLCAAAVLMLVLTAASLGGRELKRERAFRASVADGRGCVDRYGDPLERVRAPYELRALSAADQAAFEQGFPPELQGAVEARDLYRRSLEIGTVALLATSGDPGQQREFVEGVREAVEEQGGTLHVTRLAGRDVTTTELNGGALVAGPIDCGSAMVTASSAGAARKVWAMLAAPA